MEKGEIMSRTNDAKRIPTARWEQYQELIASCILMREAAPHDNAMVELSYRRALDIAATETYEDGNSTGANTTNGRE